VLERRKGGRECKTRATVPLDGFFPRFLESLQFPIAKKSIDGKSENGEGEEPGERDGKTGEGEEPEE